MEHREAKHKAKHRTSNTVLTRTLINLLLHHMKSSQDNSLADALPKREVLDAYLVWKAIGISSQAAKGAVLSPGARGAHAYNCTALPETVYAASCGTNVHPDSIKHDKVPCLRCVVERCVPPTTFCDMLLLPVKHGGCIARVRW